MREKEGYRRSTNIAHTQYTKPKKPIKSAEERRRENNSLVIRNIYTGGGNDIA